MHRILRARLLASALSLSVLPFIAVSQPAQAQTSVDVSFDSFHHQLEADGTWIRHPRYGDVWEPDDADANFHPYSRGHWVNTEEYGFTWVSDYAWGDIPFHYGRWVFDDDDGWLWVPGYVWAPAWVAWRSDSEYTGWAPLPPDERFLAGDETNYDVDPVAFYGPRHDASNIFIFVGTRHFAEPNFHAYIVQRPLVVNFFSRTRNITRIAVVNDHIVNRSIDARVVGRMQGRAIPVVSIRTVLKPGAVITNVHIGRDIQIRERAQRWKTPSNDQEHGGHDQNNNDHGNNDHGGNGNDQGHNGGGVTGGPADKDNGKHDGHPDNNTGSGANNPPAGTPSSDQTPPKHHKDAGDQTTPAATTTPPADNGAGADQTKPKHHKDAATPDQTAPAATTTPPADNGAGAMGTTDQTKPKHHKDAGAMSPDQTPPGNTTSTDNGANSMGTSADTPPKHHKATGAMPADQGAPPSATPPPPATGATTPPRTLNAPADDQSVTPKPKKKDKNKTDGQQDNSPQ